MNVRLRIMRSMHPQPHFLAQILLRVETSSKHCVRGLARQKQLSFAVLPSMSLVRCSAPFRVKQSGDETAFEPEAFEQ